MFDTRICVLMNVTLFHENVALYSPVIGKYSLATTIFELSPEKHSIVCFLNLCVEMFDLATTLREFFTRAMLTGLLNTNRKSCSLVALSDKDFIRH